jgi:hypothetical protein
MEHLIKQYSRFLGEILHLGRIFPNSLFRVHHLIQQHFYPGVPVIHQSQQKEYFCWLFFCFNIHKTSIK